MMRMLLNRLYEILDNKLKIRILTIKGRNDIQKYACNPAEKNKKLYDFQSTG